MKIVIQHDEGELHLDSEEVPAVHLDEAIAVFTTPQVPTVINQAMDCLRALRDEWNRHELAARERLLGPEKAE